MKPDMKSYDGNAPGNSNSMPIKEEDIKEEIKDEFGSLAVKDSDQSTEIYDCNENVKSPNPLNNTRDENIDGEFETISAKDVSGSKGENNGNRRLTDKGQRD